MARPSCNSCVYAVCDPEAWRRAAWRDEPLVLQCANHPWWPGRLHDVSGVPCRRYQPRPATPTGDQVRIIPLAGGFYTYVDADNFEWLNQWRWRAFAGYATRCEGNKLIYMHREIMKPPKGKVVDHVNGNGFDNTCANLRNVTRADNMHNQRRHAGTASIYKGVTRGQSSKGSWCARVAWGDHRLTAGTFPDEAEAARAYDRLAVELFGEHARVNFAEEWPPERRSQVYAEAQPKREALRAKAAKAKRRKRREQRKAAGKKPRTAKRRQKPVTKARVRKTRRVRAVPKK
jgi:hypothetical protein